MSNFRRVVSPGSEFLHQINRSLKEESLKRLLFRGVVQFVDMLGNEARPRFSLQVKVLGIDSETNQAEGRWFPPLLPIHLIAMPEVGEEVLLICEEIGNINSAYWISRDVSLNTLTKNEIGKAIESEIDPEAQKSPSQFAYEGAIPVEPLQSPDKDKKIPEPRVKPGDVVTQGRSNTFTRHTFETKNSTGYVETITEEQPVPDNTFYQDDFRSSSGSREVLITKSDLDTQIIEKINELKFDRSYLKGVAGGVDGYPKYDKNYQADGIDTLERAKNKYDTAYLLLEAIELRIISRQGKNVQHTVLAEEQERWLILLINLTKDLIDDLILFRDHVDLYRKNTDQYRADVNNFRQQGFETHTHMTPMGPSSPPLTPALTYSKSTFSKDLADRHTDYETDHSNFEVDKKNFQTDQTDFESHKKPIPIHHSKTVAIN